MSTLMKNAKFFIENDRFVVLCKHRYCALNSFVVLRVKNSAALLYELLSLVSVVRLWTCDSNIERTTAPRVR